VKTVIDEFWVIVTFSGPDQIGATVYPDGFGLLGEVASLRTREAGLLCCYSWREG